MTSGRKKRLSMLDGLATAATQNRDPAPAPSAPPMMASNRALRSARDAVDGHHVWDLDPNAIDDARLTDRLEPEDVADLRDAIETNGQTVPILVRRNPADPDRYLLVYGRRRLEAIRQSDKVATVRALVANLDDMDALRAQISENMARRDLSFIEKALFAQELVESGFGNQSQVAEVLTVTKSSVSMAIAIVEIVGRDLATAIGPAHGVGRPRWEALAKSIEAHAPDRDHLIEIARDVMVEVGVSVVADNAGDAPDPSVLAFDAVVKAVETSPAPQARRKAAPKSRSRPLTFAGRKGGTVRRRGSRLEITLDQGGFADWVESEVQSLVEELHARWQRRAED